MTTQERLEIIKQRKQKNDDAENNAIRERDEKLAKLRSDIKALAPRINDMLIVANELFANGISLGKLIKNYPWFDKEEFVAEGIHHRLGFIVVHNGGYKYAPKEIGIYGGGCCGHDFYVDHNGDIVECGILHFGTNKCCEYDPVWDFIHKAKQFIDSFDDFEKRFYDYVDTL